MRSLRLDFITTSLLVASTTAGLTGAQEPDAAAADAFVAWAAEVAVPIDLDESVAPASLAPLVNGKRFVYLGEPDHFIHQKYPFRLRFLTALHALGWRHLGMEMGRSDGLRFDRFLAGGDERDLLEIGLYSSTSDVSAAIRSGGFLGMELCYAQAVRAIATGRERIRYFGFDLDLTPGSGFHDARARLDGVAGAEELLLVLDDVWGSDDRIGELSLLLEELRNPSSTLTGGLPADLLEELVLDLDNLGESLRFGGLSIFNEPEPANLFDAFARRERMMFRLFDGYVDRLPEDQGIVLTGHNMHLSRNWENARWLELGTTLSIPLWPTIGAHVSDRFPGEVFAIWLVYDHGVHLNADNLSEEGVLESVPGTVESLLARLPHDAFLLPLASDDPRSAWLDAERTFRVNGGVGHGRLRDLTDALFFVREVEPPHTPSRADRGASTTSDE